MKKLKDLWDCHGRYFRCKIDDKECEGRICVEDDEIYLCQDIADGGESEEKFGYDYSWNITHSSENILKDTPNDDDVTEFVLLDNVSVEAPLATLSDLKVENVIKYRHFEPRLITYVDSEKVKYRRIHSGEEKEFTIKEFKEKPWAYMLIETGRSIEYLSKSSTTKLEVIDEDSIKDFVARNTLGGTELFPILNRY